jgi:hypothetical protein
MALKTISWLETKETKCKKINALIFQRIKRKALVIPFPLLFLAYAAHRIIPNLFPKTAFNHS